MFSDLGANLQRVAAPANAGGFNSSTCPSEYTELGSVQSSLNISLRGIHTVAKSRKNLIQVLGHVVLSPASMGLSCLENFLAAGLQSFVSLWPRDFSPQQCVCPNLLVFGWGDGDTGPHSAR